MFIAYLLSYVLKFSIILPPSKAFFALMLQVYALISCDNTTDSYHYSTKLAEKNK
jgi:hypothetical protein